MHRLTSTMTRGRLAMLFALGLACVGCGGGGGDGGLPPLEFSVALTIEDGVRGFDGTILSTLGPILSGEIGVGDFEGSSTGFAVGFFSFDLSGIPANATITEAIFGVKEASTAGTPESDLGLLTAEHVNIGPTLEAEDLSNGSLGRAVTMAQVLPQVYVANVVDFVAVDFVSGRGRTQIRMHYSSFDQNLDGADDFQAFESSNSPGPDNKPTIELTFTVPQ